MIVLVIETDPTICALNCVLLQILDADSNLEPKFTHRTFRYRKNDKRILKTSHNAILLEKLDFTLKKNNIDILLRRCFWFSSS